MITNHTVVAAAHPNLALVKYWGQADINLNLPNNTSISVNLSGATTTTAVTFEDELESDRVTLNGENADLHTYNRVMTHLDRIRTLAGGTKRARVESYNDFPAAAGIASSASAYAALTLAATRAAGLNLDIRELSTLARKGSGSACRSIPDGFVEWIPGQDSDSSYAKSLLSCDYWDLCIITVYFGDCEKEVSSLEGHRAATSSSFYHTRLYELPRTLQAVRAALRTRYFPTLGMAVEREAISMHTIAMTSTMVEHPWLSGIYYWQPETLHVMKAVQKWRHNGLQVYFTLDAGSSVHLLCEAQNLHVVMRELSPLLDKLGGTTLISKPGRGAWVLDKTHSASPPWIHRVKYS
ncbi:MAG: diphosphomevalonate decarboxylase [Anaerolineae bacterium]|nr:diphosphomevalonate decarboxylase [Anaerolineae bacterium]